ncbi:hypothetical protein OQJ15_14765 [Fluoribacter dumoffii]|uniref:Uncharacterized protein n=1 Tax=Fluoribacter dumoffii TaxID=463 RepID=A0A377GDS9_9GAMM|nr:hypothetical protein [Fluoribacter dumoffii]KTC91265.1 hypothetical protein Ldum_2333 [Fluoribacter dumoffii NY 23]MCW8387567.1 hypothetical protein [Fluoribacter dumoffii]MCW8497770.1 hypothetical protein [Fluoribacter dumoffii]STO22963.1 Uncharacterised protein [Fluoribacter dumoffii]
MKIRLNVILQTLSILFLTIYSISPLANALPSDFISPKKMLRSDNFKTNEFPIDYTNFSGMWIGECNAGKAQFSIKNDLEFFSIYDRKFKIGTLESKSSDDSDYNSQETTFVYWNKSHTKIIVKRIVIDKVGSEVKNGINVILEKLIFSLENDRLNIKFKSNEFDDIGALPTEESLICTLTKKK